nr:cysteine-rich receptor-like protein kinase [Tanacetum cinerariifolium]
MNYKFDPFEDMVNGNDNIAANMNEEASVNVNDRENVKERANVNKNYEPLEIMVEDDECYETMDEDDSDYIVDEDNNVEEVNVDMHDYHFNINTCVEWVRNTNRGQQKDHAPIVSDLEVLDNEYFESGLDKENEIEKIRNEVVDICMQLSLKIQSVNDLRPYALKHPLNVSKDAKSRYSRKIRMPKKDVSRRKKRWRMWWGISTTGKREWVQNMCRSEIPCVLGIQEMKCGKVEEQFVEDLWGFSARQSVGDERFIAIKGNWKGRVGDVVLANVYRPHPSNQKGEVWARLQNLIEKNNAAWCVFGDFNEVRGCDDRMNTQFHTKESNEFNEFIERTLLMEIPMGVVVSQGKEAMRWECEAETRGLDEDELKAWMGARRLWLEKDGEKANILKQKARVRWDAEGYENSKYFHAAVKRRNNKNNIRGLLVNGVWNENLNDIKNKMMRFWDIIKPDLVKEVELFWETGEISKGCNASFITLILKVADPIGLGDFRPISLIGSYYKIIAKMLAERVKLVVGKLVGEVRNVFIKGRYILDGVLITNETVRGKWCRWIEECMKSASVSVLVNGSPTKEFQMGRGVRQGDSLSPFLCILAAEGLKAMVKEAVTKGIFNGVQIGRIGESVTMGDGGGGVCGDIVRVRRDIDNLDRCKESAVAKKGRWVEGTWRWVWIWVREPRGRVVGEVEALEQVIRNTNITLSCRDKWKWVLDDSGIFSMKALSELVEVKCINTGNHNSDTT